MVNPTPVAPAQPRFRLALGAVVVMLLGIPQASDAQGLVQGVQQGAQAGNKAAGPVGGVLGGQSAGWSGRLPACSVSAGKGDSRPLRAAPSKLGLRKQPKPRRTRRRPLSRWY